MRVGGFGLPEMIVLTIVVVIVIAVARNFKKGGLLGGAFVGALLGFLFRPSVPFVGQLPLGVVLTRGVYLNGVDVLLRSSAETSFNYVIIGAILGAVIMAAAKGR